MDIVTLVRDYRNGVRPGYIWQGVYQHYEDVPANGGGFDGEVWLEARRRNLDWRIASSKKGKQVESFLSEDTLLPYLVSIISAESASIRILDFGGGLGETYLDLRKALSAGHSIEYHVIETPRMCEQGNSLFADDSQIRFHSALPAELPSVDVIYVSSALQYVEDYGAFLRRLCAYRARFILFVKLSAGAIPTYATAQKNLRGSTVPYWFINIEELTELLRGEGYARIFGNVLAREYNQDNFPEKYRMKQACNLLFVNSDSTATQHVAR
jgi:putative methyltransferase (TIGR04325 family)